ncbi:TonB-dependent receptor [uncultured Sphingomonas sp.]|uniref:TonB-dependent receptor n=1 Tax=uncultured Sphingomonas sp. TaxID=158754 RepID=UPI0035CA04A1
MIHAVPALAQTAPAPAGPAPAAAAVGQAGDDVAGAGDIIVTARRVEERLQDVPISITTFSQQQLASRNITTAADLSIYTPSLQTDNFFGATKTQFSIRGFVQNLGTQPSVGVYFADVVAPRAPAVNVPAGDGAGPGSLFDLENVQVLKGPQGTLFGRNTTGGAVLLVPQRPKDTLGGYVEASYGNYDMKRIQGVFNTPLGDRARLRIGVDHMERDGYLRNDSGIGPGRLADVNYTSIRASLVVDLTPTLENYTIASYTRSRTNGDQQKLAVCDPAVGLGALACAQLAGEAAKGADFFTLQNVIPESTDNLTQWQVVNTTTWQAGDNVTIKNIASYAQLTERYSSGVFGTVLDTSLFVPFYAKGTVVGLNSLQPAPNLPTADQYTMTEEFRVQGTSLNGRLNWQSGAYLEVSQPLGQSGYRIQTLVNCANLDTLVCNNPLGAGGVIEQTARTRFHDVGLYAQSTYSLTDTLKLTGGFRYTWDRVRTDANLLSYSFAPGPVAAPSTATACGEPGLTLPTCAVTFREQSSKPTWLIDLDYKPGRDVLIYAKYARGYRAGGIAANVPSQFAVFGPEKVDSYELGLKTSFRGAVRGTFDVSAFYNDFSDQQLNVLFNPKPGTNVPTISGIFNAGRSRISGVEVSGTITPFRGFTLEGAYTYLHTELRSVSLAATPANSPYTIGASEFPGDPLTFAPKNKFTATGTYTLPIDPSAGMVSVGATFVHEDRMLTNYASRDANGRLFGYSYVKARDLLNLNANWNDIAGSNIDLALFATNVLQKKYYSVFAPLLPIVGFTSGTVGEPRMYGLRLRYRFGN